MDSIHTNIHDKPVPLFHISGTHREMGRQIGECARQQVLHSVENARLLLESAYDELHLTWEGANIQGRKYMPFAQERYPQYIDEMIGIAEGAGVDFDDIATLNAMEAVTMDALHLTKCTSIAVNEQHTSDEHVLVGHNEDWLPEDEPDVFLVHATPLDEPPFLAMTYGGLLPNIGFNAAGIAQCCDTIYANDSRIGIPRVVVSRAVLGAANLGDAIRCTLTPHRAAGYNHLLAHESGELYNVEVSAKRFAILYGEDGYVLHTNFLLDHQMQIIEDEPDELIETRVRYFRALRLLRSTQMHTTKTIQTILKDHTNYPNSICNHAEYGLKPLEREKSINSMVIDLTAKVMHIAWGNPCANTYHTFYLEEPTSGFPTSQTH
jgi:isopenicillin-N N-acyltransferase-like protein